MSTYCFVKEITPEHGGLELLAHIPNQARSQDRIWGSAEPPKSGLLDPKSGLFEPHPP